MAVDQRLEYELIASAVHELRVRGFGEAVAAIQTGSGIDAPELEEPRSIAWSDLPGFPPATAPGHAGMLHCGRLRGVPVLVLDGRFHLYEGHTPAEVVRPVRAIGLLGVGNLILTNATGGLREDLCAGDVVRVTDHLNLMGCDPLEGIHDDRFGDRFVVTAGRSHDPHLAELADAAARDAEVDLATGVYAGLRGPTFESPAEVRMLRGLGADVCGMSTVPEVLAAAQFGLAVLVLSLVANPAGQVAEGARAEDEVLAVGAQSGARLMRVVEGVVERLGS